MMVEIAARAVQVLIALGGAYLVALWFVLVVWTFRDIESRSRSVFTQVFSTLLAVLFFVPGVLLYLILRPKETVDETFQRSLEEEYLLQDLEELPLCSACHRYVEDDFVLCPHCHAQLREPCLNCSRQVDLRWALCPYCAAVQHGRSAPSDQVEAPAARWTAPALRRRRQVELPVPVRADSVPGTRPADRPMIAATSAQSEALAPEEPAADSRAIASALVSSVRSFVRPLDRFRARPTEFSESAVSEPETHAAERDSTPFELDESRPENGHVVNVGFDSLAPSRFRPNAQEPNGNGQNGRHRASNGVPEPFPGDSLVLLSTEAEPEEDPTPAAPVTWPKTDRE